jgi:hypothetical protein
VELIEYYFNMSSSLPRALNALADPETGQFRPSAPSDRLAAPTRVALEGEVLCFDWGEGEGLATFDDDTCPGATIRFITPPTTLLERFLRLRTDEAIVTFARQFGPLAPRGLSMQDMEAASGRSEHRESLGHWREWQQKLDGLLALIAAVRDKQSPRRETFVALHELDSLPAVDRLTLPALGPLIITQWERCSLTDRLDAARIVVMTNTRTYVRQAALRPALRLTPMRRTGTRFDVVFQDARADYAGGGVSLFGALIMQLIAAATGAPLAMCSACGHFFVPRRRRPAFGKRRYCRACGRAAAVRDAVADYRNRERITRQARQKRRSR